MSIVLNVLKIKNNIMPPQPQRMPQDSFSHSPVSDAALHLLGHNEGFTDTYLEEKLDTHRALISQHAGKVGMALALTDEIRHNRTPLIHDEVMHEDPADYPEGSQKHEHLTEIHDYIEGADNPEDKMAMDDKIVSEMLRTLGPTNTLRILSQSKDAGLDIGSMVRLLERDYLGVVGAYDIDSREPVDMSSEGLNKPELRFTEGLLRAELALLWRPNMAGLLEDVHEGGFKYDINDPNVILPGKMAESDRKNRWQTIGIKLFDDAAKIFEAISKSETAPADTKLEALCRMTDLKIAGLRIEMMRATAKQEKDEIVTEMSRLNTAYLKHISDFAENEFNAEVGNGTLFELWMAGITRAKLHKDRDYMTTVRLSLTREDNDHIDIERLKNRHNIKYNLSSDLILEDINGNKKKIIQLKAYPRAGYTEEKQGRYLPGLIELEFEDDYPNNILEQRRLARETAKEQVRAAQQATRNGLRARR